MNMFSHAAFVVAADSSYFSEQGEPAQTEFVGRLLNEKAEVVRGNWE